MRGSVQTVDTSLPAAALDGASLDSALVDATPVDEAGADRVMAGFHRISGQRIVLGADQATCTVFGRRHRTTVERLVPLSVALGLARRGVNTVVRVSGD